MLKKGHSCYRPRRTGERKRKSVRGCIVDANMSVLALIVVRKGEKEVPGLTDNQVPRRLGPKRASKIRKLYNLTKEDNVCQYVVRRPLPKKEGKKLRHKAPKIQRLVTPNVLQVSLSHRKTVWTQCLTDDFFFIYLQRKRHRLSIKKKRQSAVKEQAAEYAKLLAKRKKESKQKREEAKRRRSASLRESRTSQSSDKK